tara:strand:+ start:994 stop:1521 length:528 start_codon:yes stop_codon:yes gene_type:complete
MIVTDIILNKKNIVYFDPPNYYIKKNNRFILVNELILKKNGSLKKKYIKGGTNILFNNFKANIKNSLDAILVKIYSIIEKDLEESSITIDNILEKPERCQILKQQILPKLLINTGQYNIEQLPIEQLPNYNSILKFVLLSLFHHKVNSEQNIDINIINKQYNDLILNCKLYINNE